MIVFHNIVVNNSTKVGSLSSDREITQIKRAFKLLIKYWFKLIGSC